VLIDLYSRRVVGWGDAQIIEPTRRAAQHERRWQLLRQRRRWPPGAADCEASTCNQPPRAASSRAAARGGNAGRSDDPDHIERTEEAEHGIGRK